MCVCVCVCVCLAGAIREVWKQKLQQQMSQRLAEDRRAMEETRRLYNEEIVDEEEEEAEFTGEYFLSVCLLSDCVCLIVCMSV